MAWICEKCGRRTSAMIVKNQGKKCAFRGCNGKLKESPKVSSKLTGR